MGSETYSLKSTPIDKYLRNFLWQFYKSWDFLPADYWEKIGDWNISFLFSFIWVAYAGIWTMLVGWVYLKNIVKPFTNNFYYFMYMDEPFELAIFYTIFNFE